MDFEKNILQPWLLILTLLTIFYHIYNNLDSDETAVGIYLNLQKAFDIVNHDILLYKLYNYGVRGVAYKWFVSYLSNRKEFTCIKMLALLCYA